MNNLIFLTGYEHGVATLVASGGGLASYVSQPTLITVSSEQAHTGTYSLKVAPITGTDAYYRVAVSTPNVVVGRFYFYVGTEPTASEAMIFDVSCTTSLVATNPGIYLVPANNTVQIRTGSGVVIATSSNAYTVGQWHYIDFSFDMNQNPWALKAKLDGGTEFSGNSAQAFDSATNLRFGNDTGSPYVIYMDDCIFTDALANYPIGAGGTELLLPSADGTHNAGASVVTDNDGSAFNGTTVFAYDLLNSVPPSAGSYVKQRSTGATNYAEILFANIVATHSAILGAQGFLTYTSATTSSNRGACMISKDAFATNTAVRGSDVATIDYSDGNTGAPFYTKALIAGVVDDTTVNALTARMGYSGDVNPNPYWIDLSVEVAYGTGAAPDIDLDLVTYSSTINDITVLENVAESLDLVSYSSTINDITVTENANTELDLVSYSSTINDITMLESAIETLDLVSFSITINDITVIDSIIESLDLVTYSSTVNDITMLESIIDSLDLVTYLSTVNDITVLEGVIDQLDLVTYSSTVNDITMLDSIVDLLDLVSYFSTINDITTFESVIESLDLATYSSTINDITMLESIIYSLDLVTYSSTFYDVELLEAGTTDLDLIMYSSTINDLVVLESVIELLDLVSYSSVVNDLVILESIIESLDLVTYFSTFNDVELLEAGDINLDLVSYSSSVNDITMLESIIYSLDLVTYSSIINDIAVLENALELLDLITYFGVINEISVLESVIETLDLVNYSNTFYEVSLTEEGSLDLDLIVYSSTINEVTILENEVDLLDLVSYSSTINDSLFEAIVVLGEPSGTLTSWDGSFHWTGIAEATWYQLIVKNLNDDILYGGWLNVADVGGGLDCSFIPPLDLANGDYKWQILDYGLYGYGVYTPFNFFTLDIPIPIVVLGEPSGTLTSWDGSFHWTGIAEATWYYMEIQNLSGAVIWGVWYTVADVGGGLDCSIIPPGLNLTNGEYKWRVQDYGPYGYGPFTELQGFILDILAPLDLVTYSSVVNDVTLLETIVESLDLVIYSSTVNEITVLAIVVDTLDLVSYSSTVNDITVLENVVESLDLVTYISVFYDLYLVTPIDRVYAIGQDFRIFAIREQDRTYSIVEQHRVYAVTQQNRIFPISY